MRRWCGLALAGALVAAAPVARADEPPAGGSTFPVTLQTDLPALATGFLLLAVPPLVSNELAPPHCGTSTTLPCDPTDLNPLDRLAIDNDGESSALVSDVMLFSTPVVAATLFAALDWRELGWQSFGEDIILMGEVAVISGGLQQLSSLAVRRPRPYLYTPGLRSQEERDAPGAAQSFFSGHASTVFGVATSFAYIVTKRRPDMDHPWAVWVAALTVATPVPILRVNAGSHFWTDTITGTVVGVGTGLIVPFLHEHDAPGGVALRPHAGPGTIGLAGSF